MVDLETNGIAETMPLPEPDPVWRCRACSHVITRRKTRIEVLGAHEHTFRNPAGSYHVLCFQEAPGCIGSGAFTGEATWFAQFLWCLALCGECHTHLGWLYSRGEEDFAGLIATRIH